MQPQRTEPQWRGTPDCRGTRRARIWSLGSCRGGQVTGFQLAGQQEPACQHF